MRQYWDHKENSLCKFIIIVTYSQEYTFSLYVNWIVSHTRKGNYSVKGRLIVCVLLDNSMIVMSIVDQFCGFYVDITFHWSL